MNKIFNKLYAFEQTHKWVVCIGFIMICSLFIYNFYFGERMPVYVNHGLGWDGNVFAGMAQFDPLQVLTNKEWCEYTTSRMLTSAIIHYGSCIMGYSLNTPQGIIQVFYIYDCILLLFGVFILSLFAKKYKWPLPICLISFTGIFINYPILKLMMYHPNTTDVTGMIIGFLMTYLYLDNRIILFFIAAFFASFAWPSMLYILFPLMLFKAQKINLSDFVPSTFSNIVAGAIGLFVVGLAYIPIIQIGVDKFPYAYLYIDVRSNIILSLSAGFLCIYLFLALRRFVDLKYISLQLKNNVDYSRLCFGLLFFILIKGILISISSQEIGPFNGPLDFLNKITMAGMLNPLVNIISHTLYYGPIVLLIIFSWKDFVKVVKEAGLGLTSFIILNIFILIGSESRQAIPALPMFIVLICNVLNSRKIGWSFAYPLTILSLIISRFWLPNNTGFWTGRLGTFPDQMLYMNFGPWLSNIMYTVFVGVTVILGICIWSLLKNSQYLIIPRE